MIKVLVLLGICAQSLLLFYIISSYPKENCDNIQQKCYSSNRNLPIDVVYTWVNGSDPLLQRSVEYYKKLYADPNYGRSNSSNEIANKLKIFTGRSLLSIDENKGGSENSQKIVDNPFEIPKECPIENCIASPAVVSSSYISPDTFTLEQLKQFVGFANALEIKYAKPENAEDSTLLFIKFPSISDAKLASGRIVSRGSFTIKFRPVFYTLQHGKGPFVKTSSQLVDISHCQLEDPVKFPGVLSYDDIQGIICVENKDLSLLKENCNGIIGKETFLVWPPWEKYMIGQLSIQDVGAHRFADNEELRYSLRSLYKFAPWVRNIYILTNGQIPNWLNVHHSRIKVVTHAEVFQNKSHLPTFSSPSIEANMHNIPGLSEHFLYFNDDVFLGRPVYPEDFVSTEGYKVFLAWNIPNCNTGCPANWLTDGYCDLACNVSACNFDGGDCQPGSEAVARLANNAMNAVPGAAAFAQNYCNPGCSQSWVGDKYCDPACNVIKCGFDAGDCGTKDVKSSLFEVQLKLAINNTAVNVPMGVDAMYINMSLPNGTVDAASFECEDATVVRTSILSLQHKIVSLTFYPDKINNVSLSFTFSNHSSQLIILALNTTPVDEPYAKIETTDLNSDHLVPQEEWLIPEKVEMTLAEDYSDMINNIIKDVNSKDLSQSAQIFDESLTKLVDTGLLTEKGRWVKLAQFISNEKLSHSAHEVPQRQLNAVERLPNRQLLDTFADSLHHVNNIYTATFGKEQRKVLSHMPFLVNRTILRDLQSRFPKEFNKTSSNKFRSSDDMQFSFSYYYFIIHASHKQSLDQFLRDCDINHDNTYSNGELNILMTRLFTLPLSDTNRTLFWDTIKNCSVSQNVSHFGPGNIISCDKIHSLVNATLMDVKTYQHEIVNDKDVTFKMLKSNSTKVRIDLDYVRNHPKKFICLNDNMDHGISYEHLENKRMLSEFYKTMFPEPSPFEHPPGTLNTFIYKDELLQYLDYHNNLYCIVFAVVFFISLLYLSYLKRRSLKRLIGGILIRFIQR